MTLKKTLHSLRSAFSRKPKSRPRRARRPLFLENLEDRRLLATFTVQNLDGHGAGSLREAINDANANSGMDDIEFLASLGGGAISIAQVLPDITDSVNITGPAGLFGLFETGITIDAQDTVGVRPLFVTDTAAKVTLENLTLKGGNMTGSAITEEKLGGGLFNLGPDTTLKNVVVQNNTAYWRGGGIYNEGTLSVQGSTFDGNTALDGGSGGGGGIYNTGTLVLTDSTIDGNESGGFGGGIANSDSLEAGTVTVENSTIANNTAAQDGGGIANFGTLTIKNSTIAENTTDDSGGGVFNGSPTTSTVTNSTITGNTAAVSGGGYLMSVSSTGHTVRNSIVAENVDVLNNPDDGWGLGDPSNWIGEIAGDPLLGRLRDNGGPTKTRKPLTDSPVIDAGDNAHVTRPNSATDQRGEDRIIDGDHDGTATVDIGAVEHIPDAEIHGQKFHDLNGNGARDPDEPGLDGWTIQLFKGLGGEPLQEKVTQSIDLNEDGLIDAETEQGLYKFVGLDAGTYEVVEVLQDGWVQTASPDAVSVTIERVDGVDFGNAQFLGVIRGQKFHDLNENGAKDPDEPGLDDWTIRLLDPKVIEPLAEQITRSEDLNGDGTIDPSTEQGLYEFTALAPGTYTVSEILQPGWYPTLEPDSVTVITTEVYENVDLGNAERVQIVASPDDTLEVPIPTNSTVHIPVQYNTSDSNPHTTGLGVRMHFNSALLTFDGLSNAAPNPVQTEQLLPDTEDFDNDLSTDMFVLTAWSNHQSIWPNLALPTKLYDSQFSVVGSLSHAITTTINFTDSSTDVRYNFLGRPITVELLPASLDIDGNGEADALSDALLAIRFLFGARGLTLVDNAVASDATRTDPEDIASYLAYLRGTMLDVDVNGRANALQDGALIQRYLFGFEDNQLVDGVLASDATRTDAAEITEFLQQFDPSVEIATELIDEVVLGNFNAEGEGFIGPIAPAGGHQILATAPRRSTASDKAVSFDVTYATDPPGAGTTGLGTRFHFDSGQLEFAALTNAAEGLIVEQVQNDTNDLDANPTTDKFLLTGFFDVNGNWPSGSSSNVRLGTIDFVMTDDFFGPTTLNVTSAATAGGFELAAPSVTIGKPHTNPKNVWDVNGDGAISPVDSLIVINRVNDTGSELLDELNVSAFSMDVNNDGHVSPLDALWVINWLNGDAEPAN